MKLLTKLALFVTVALTLNLLLLQATLFVWRALFSKTPLVWPAWAAPYKEHFERVVAPQARAPA